MGEDKDFQLANSSTAHYYCHARIWFFPSLNGVYEIFAQGHFKLLVKAYIIL